MRYIRVAARAAGLHFIRLREQTKGRTKRMLAGRSVMTTKTAVTSIAVLVLSLVLGGASLGQIKSGAIVGIVTDPGGAVVPGAKVSAVNQETNVATTTVTD